MALLDLGQVLSVPHCRGSLEGARERHTQQHGAAVFVSAIDWSAHEDGTPRRDALTFSEAEMIAIEAMKLPLAARRRSCGFATVTALVSSGPPCPRKPLSVAFGQPAGPASSFG